MSTVRELIDAHDVTPHVLAAATRSLGQVYGRRGLGDARQLAAFVPAVAQLERAYQSLPVEPPVIVVLPRNPRPRKKRSAA